MWYLLGYIAGWLADLGERLADRFSNICEKMGAGEDRLNDGWVDAYYNYGWKNSQELKQ